MKSQASLLGREFIINVINELSALEASLRWSSHPRIMLEVALIKICSMYEVKSGNDLNIEVKNDGKKGAGDNTHTNVHRNGAQTNKNWNDKKYDEPVKNAAGNEAAGNSDGDAGNSATGNTVTGNSLTGNNLTGNSAIGNSMIDGNLPSNNTVNKADKKEETSLRNLHNKEETSSTDLQGDLNDIWIEVLKELSSYGKRPLCICLSKAKVVKLNKNAVGIIFPQQGKVNKDIASQTDNLQLIEKAFKTVTKKDIQVKCMLEKEAENYIGGEETPNESLSGNEDENDDVVNKIMDFADKYNIPINVIDE